VYINIYKKLPIHDEQLAAIMLPKLEGTTLHGHFYSTVIDTKLKITGFVIYNTSNMNDVSGMTTPFIESELLFILVDKKYQRRNMGTELMVQFMDDVKSRRIMAVMVKIEAKFERWYNIFGFKVDPVYQRRDFIKMMYYSPVYRLMMQFMNPLK
jgi:GNAT superfamily N-acetyltransferase